MEDENISIDVTDKPKKRAIKGRNRDSFKKAKLIGHTTGPNCACKRFGCFKVVRHDEKLRIIAHFNAFQSKDEQHGSYLDS